MTFSNQRNYMKQKLKFTNKIERTREIAIKMFNFI